MSSHWFTDMFVSMGWEDIDSVYMSLQIESLAVHYNLILLNARQDSSVAK